MGSSSHYPQLTCEVWKLLGKNCSLYRVNKVLYTECKSWPWPLTPWPQINRFPPFIINNLHVKFKSDWAKTAVCIVSTRSYTQSAKVDLDLWPRDPKSIGFPKIKTTIIYSNRNSKVGSFEIAKIKITKIISHTFTFKSWKFPAIRYWERWTGWHSVVLCCRYTYRKIHTHFYDLMFCSHWKF